MLTDLITWFDQYPLLWPLFIIPARIADVSLGTVRILSVMRGQRFAATVLGFFEVLIWVSVVSGVLVEITEIKLVSYALGFALGNLVGIWLEQLDVLGHQMVTLISEKRTQSVAFALRLANYGVTEIPAKGGRGNVAMCFAVVPRRKTLKLIATARAVDASVHIVVGDINSTDLMMPTTAITPTGWHAVFKRK